MIVMHKFLRLFFCVRKIGDCFGYIFFFFLRFFVASLSLSVVRGRESFEDKNFGALEW